MAKEDGIYLDVLQRHLIPWSDAFARVHIHPTGDGRYLIDREGCERLSAAVRAFEDACVSLVESIAAFDITNLSTLPPGHGARYHGSRGRR